MAGLNTFVTLSRTDATFTTNKSDFRVPTSRSFSFSISDFWKPTKEPFMQWIKELPTPDKRKKSFEPAQYHTLTLKHSLDSDDDSDDGSSYDEHEHRHKRAKTGSALGQHQTVESRRRKLVNSGRGLARRVSSACQRAVTPSSRSRYQSLSSRHSFLPRGSTPAPEPTPPPGTPISMLIDRPKMRFVVVGDAECGKSSMLLRFYRDTFNMNHTPTHYELFNKVVKVNEHDTDLELWDTSGDITLDQLARLNYLAWDAVFLCFSVNSPRSFNNARTQWITQIRLYTRGAPIILVGMKTDQRVGASLWAPLYPNLETRITATEGAMTATAIGANRYIECSAKTGQGIHGAFEEGVRAAFARRAAMEKLTDKKIDHLSHLADFLCFK